jgi:hypothetical protein
MEILTKRPNQLPGGKVAIVCDRTSLFSTLQKGTSKRPALCVALKMLTRSMTQLASCLVAGEVNIFHKNLFGYGHRWRPDVLAEIGRTTKADVMILEIGVENQMRFITDETQQTKHGLLLRLRIRVPFLAQRRVPRRPPCQICGMMAARYHRCGICRLVSCSRCDMYDACCDRRQ